MKKLFSFISIVVFISNFCFAQTTSISGIINSYTSVSAVGLQSATVASTTSFAVGSRVLLIQMKGATINTTNNNSYGTIISYNNAGNYEMATIASIVGSTINFVSPVSRSYTPSDLVQLIAVPSYNNVVITGQLTCTPWNGSTGGVLAFEAGGTITFNADIDVSGKGFLGGALSNGAITSCSADTFDYVLPINSLAGAQKGEGIFNPNSTNTFGKGAWANGGGSGNDCNGGGAGGGNFGLGGHGGDPKVNVSCPPFFYQNSGGNSGKSLTYSNAINKIFLGGGGGAGHQNNSAGTAGTNGGGIVLISGQNIVGNNHYINSNGVDNTIVAGIDGQGGGGAGGTILLNVCSYISLNVSVIGGLGGHDNFTGPDCHGKGGGGAGGIVWSSSPLTNVTTFLTGGLPGVFTNSGSQCLGTSNGATAGGLGGTLTGLVVPGSTTPIKILDTTICSSSLVVLDAGIGASYIWSNGSTTQTISINNAGTYWVQVNPLNGCTPIIDSFYLHIVTPPIINILKDTTVCSNVTLNLNASQANATSYNWSTGATSSSINVSNSGLYWVDMNINGCTVRDSATVNIINAPLINLIRDTSLCTNGVYNLNESQANATSYNWSTGATSSSINVSNSGLYWVDMNINGCITRDSATINIVNIPVVNLIRDTSLCTSGVYNLNESQANATSYNWSTGATSSSINVSNSGLYWVDVTVNGCATRDSATITILNQPVLTTYNYTVCSNQTVSITPFVSGGTGVYTYNWGNGYSGASYTTTPIADSIYSISVTDANGCFTSINTGSISVLTALQVNANGTSTCASIDTISVLATASGGTGNYTYTWLPLNTHKNPLLVSPQTTTIYTVTVSDICGIVSDTAQIVITPAPLISLPNSISGCNPVCLNLNNIPYNTLSTWQWNFGDGSSSSIQKPFHCFTKQGNYNVSFSYTTTLGCLKTVTSNSIVTVFPSPIAAFTASTFNTDIFNTDISFYNQSAGYIISQWYFGDSNGSNLTNPTHMYLSEMEGNYPVTLIVQNQQGCTDTVIHEIIVHDVFTFYAPNAFSPNGDVYNERFLPIGTGWDNNSFKMWIFDRWGNQILNTTNPNQGWDGKIKGHDAQQDVYVWKVELKDIFNKSHSYSGVISIIR